MLRLAGIPHDEPSNVESHLEEAKKNGRLRASFRPYEQFLKGLGLEVSQHIYLDPHCSQLPEFSPFHYRLRHRTESSLRFFSVTGRILQSEFLLS